MGLGLYLNYRGPQKAWLGRQKSAMGWQKSDEQEKVVIKREFTRTGAGGRGEFASFRHCRNHLAFYK